MKRYKVTLDADERLPLHDLIAAGKAVARKLAHARILLNADDDGKCPDEAPTTLPDTLSLASYFDDPPIFCQSRGHFSR